MERKILLLFAALIIFSIETYAQVKNAEPTYYFYNQNLGAEFFSLVRENKNVENIVDGALEAADIDLDLPENGEPSAPALLYQNVKKRFAKQFADLMKQDFSISFKDLNQLDGKITYNPNTNQPNQAGIKKAIKKAPGEDFYAYYSLQLAKRTNIGGSALGAVGPKAVSAGGNLKPVFFFSFKLYDSKGKELDKIDITHKSKLVIGKSRTSVGNLDTSSDENRITPQEVEDKLAEAHHEMLEAFKEEFLKNHKKEYK